jgi:hypothetical protein
VFVDGVRQRWVRQDGGQAFGVEVAEFDLRSVLAGEGRRRGAFEMISDSIGMSGADNAQYRSTDTLGRLLNMMRDPLLAHGVAIIERGRSCELADELDVSFRAELVQRMRVGELIVAVAAIAKIGVDEKDLAVALGCPAHGLHQWIARCHDPHQRLLAGFL